MKIQNKLQTCFSLNEIHRNPHNVAILDEKSPFTLLTSNPITKALQQFRSNIDYQVVLIQVGADATVNVTFEILFSRFRADKKRGRRGLEALQSTVAWTGEIAKHLFEHGNKYQSDRRTFIRISKVERERARQKGAARCGIRIVQLMITT
jgi:hypothetical protein